MKPNNNVLYFCYMGSDTINWDGVSVTIDDNSIAMTREPLFSIFHYAGNLFRAELQYNKLFPVSSELYVPFNTYPWADIDQV